VPDGVLKEVLGAHRLLAKLARRLLVHELVRVAVTGDLVTGFRNAAHERRRALREPAEHEERCVHAALGQYFHQPFGVALHAQLARAPAGARNRRAERGNMKVILHVDREGIDLAGGGARRWSVAIHAVG